MDLQEVKLLLKKGLVQIFSANVINKFVQFGTVACLTRIIPKGEYGAFSYAQNIMSIVLLMEGLGVTSGILQYCSIANDEEEKTSIFSFGIKFGVIVNVILSIVLLMYGVFGKLPDGFESSRPFIMLLAFVPILTVCYNTIQSYLRSTLRNTEFSVLTTFNTVVYFISTVVFSLLMGANGIIVGMYIGYLSTALLGFWFIRKDIFGKKLKSIDSFNFDRKKFLKYSLITVLTNAMSQMLFLLDTQMIGIFVNSDTVLASYKIATMIPFNLTFIPISIMVFVYPYFARYRNNKEWITRRLKQITLGLFVLNTFIAVVGILSADFIIPLLFGSEYVSAIPCFKILMFGYIIAGTIRTPFGNIIASFGEVKYNLINSAITGVANIILNLILITNYGSIGAAYATVAAYIIASIIHVIFMRCSIKNIKEGV